MTRRLENWLSSYVEYASCAEAPRHIHFWAGVSAIAGALRRRVWFDQVKFRWFPSFYIIFVGPPAVITKSTTADGSMNLLRRVPGINFGPENVTWQQLAVTFANACESFEYKGEYFPMSAITLVASEFGSLMNFEDGGMTNFMIELWDGKKHYEKQTKTSGSDMIEAPWLNILGCTTPQWITANMNQTTIGGGFTSRCVFIYGDKKERPIAYLKNARPQNYAVLEEALVQDLEHIAMSLVGEYEITPEAEAWGTTWYNHIWEKEYTLDNDDWLNGYLGRKQAHLHKLAIVIAAAQRDKLILTLEDLQLANTMLAQVEPAMQKVFTRVGKSDGGIAQDRLLAVLKRHGDLSYEDAYRILMVHFPDARNLENALATVIRAGYVSLDRGKNPPTLKYLGGFEG